MDTSLCFWKANNVKSACSEKLTPLSVDFDAKTGLFPSSRGNKTYLCSLEQCPCTDFSINRKPCKHMIRLAHELHVITLEGVKSSSAAAEEKQSLSAADAFVKDEPLSTVISVFKTAEALVNGEIVSGSQLSALRASVPCLVTEKGTFNSNAWPVFSSMKAKLNNRLGLLLVEHIGEVPSDVWRTLCWLDDPYSTVKTPDETNASAPGTKKAPRPAVTFDDLIAQLTQKGISYKDMRPSGGCLWVESTGRADALLKGISVDGFNPVLMPESRHFSGRRAWYIK